MKTAKTGDDTSKDFGVLTASIAIGSLFLIGFVLFTQSYNFEREDTDTLASQESNDTPAVETRGVSFGGALQTTDDVRIGQFPNGLIRSQDTIVDLSGITGPIEHYKGTLVSNDFQSSAFGYYENWVEENNYEFIRKDRSEGELLARKERATFPKVMVGVDKLEQNTVRIRLGYTKK